MLEAIVLATHNVGEADRFCILFTRERGKLTARARSVRKPGSKLGGHLLPLQHLKLQVREGSAGYVVSDAEKYSLWEKSDITAFLHASQGMELLLTTLHDDEPMPELFDTTLEFLTICTKRSEHTVLPFTIRLLHLLGLLPDADETFFRSTAASQKEYLRKASGGAWDNLPELSAPERSQFSKLCAELLSGISSKPLKSGAVLNAVNLSAR